MIRRRDGAWLPFWRLHDWVPGGTVDRGWVVTVEYRTDDGRHAIRSTVPARWRIVALWRGLRRQVRVR